MVQAPPPSRPTWILKAICIAAVALGGIGLLTGAVGVGGLLAADRLDGSRLFRAQGSGGDRLGQIQRDMQAEMQALAAEWNGLSMAILSAQLVVALGLIAGGVLAFRLDARGRALLVAVFVTALVLEAARLWPTTAILRGNAEVAQRYLDQLVPRGGSSASPAPQHLSSTLRAVTGASMLASWAFTMAAALLKIAFFAFGAVHLGRRGVRRVFDDGPAGPGRSPPQPG